MNINGFLKNSYSNGPGKRFVLWTQGCHFNCHGCRNPETHSFNKNMELSIDRILSLIPHDTDGISITGGEPFDQPNGTLLLCNKYKEIYPNKNILIFTGYNLNELDYDLSDIDILIAGRYMKELETPECWKEWKGSSNQKLIFLNDKIDKTIRNKNKYELFVKNGQLTVTGFPSDNDLKNF